MQVSIYVIAIVSHFITALYDRKIRYLARSEIDNNLFVHFLSRRFGFTVIRFRYQKSIIRKSCSIRLNVMLPVCF